MEFWVWVQTVGAVLAGCLLAGMFFSAFFVIRRDERTGGDGWNLPAKVYWLWTVPLMFLAAVIYSLH